MVEVSVEGPVRKRNLAVRLTAIYIALAVAPLLAVAGFVVVAWNRHWLAVEPAAVPPMLLFGAALLVGGVAAALGISVYLRRQLSLPLRELRDTARTLSEGGRIVPRLRGDAELAEVAASLDLLAGRIALITGDLEERVSERTRQLGQALGELQLLKKLNEAIIHNIPSGIGVLAENGRLLYMNAAFERTWGIKAALLGSDLSLLGAAGPLGEIDWAAEARRVVESGTPRRNVTIETGEWPNRRVLRYSLFSLPTAELEGPLGLVGEEFCLAVVAPPDCGNDCENCYAHSHTWHGRHALLLVDDITDQQHLEAQLIQSEKLAALGQLSAGVAHEIRNPLSAISGAAFYIGDVLTDDVPDLSDIDDYVALIQRNVDRAQRIVTDILNFARPSSASERSVCDLSELARQTLAILDKAMVDQGVRLTADLAAESPVICRGETIKQALLNLIVNGLQAMPEGGGLTVATALHEGQGVLSVSDTGPGIPPEIMSQIFNPFFTTKPAGQGTGLGLSIARQAVENDGGRLEVESQNGRGTTFRIWLPAAAGDERETDLTTSAAALGRQ